MSVPALEILSSRQFPDWLAEQCLSLAFTTYQAGKLFLIGLKPDGRLSILERSFNRCMGLWGDGQTLLMGSLYQLWRFENVLGDGEACPDYDRIYVPRLAYTTGDLDVHDVAIDAQGRPIFVNTLFSCLATVSERHSFVPLWRPPFISRIAAEDRCHLNGLALREGRARYVTSVSRSDVADGWRDRRAGGGCVIDVVANEIVVAGLSMPHSPRIYQDRLWLLDSGTGYLGWVDADAGRFEPLTFCPGYPRGLCFAGPFAIVGVSKPRENRSLSGLKLGETLLKADAEPRCGVLVIDLKSGDIVHWLRIEGLITELYDVIALPGVVRPAAHGLKGDEIRRVLTVGAPQRL